VKAEFSEFSYGFAVTSEVDERLGDDLIAAPVFPSLRQERDLGWDVKLRVAGDSMYLQFKPVALPTRVDGLARSFRKRPSAQGNCYLCGSFLGVEMVLIEKQLQ
jgi:hypothetical protein